LQKCTARALDPAFHPSGRDFARVSYLGPLEVEAGPDHEDQLPPVRTLRVQEPNQVVAVELLHLVLPLASHIRSPFLLHDTGPLAGMEVTVLVHVRVSWDTHKVAWVTHPG